MGIVQRLPQRFKESVTFYRYVNRTREDVGDAVDVHFSYARGGDSRLGSFSEFENDFDMRAIIDDPPEGLREKDFVNRENGQTLVVKHVYTGSGITRLELSEDN